MKYHKIKFGLFIAILQTIAFVSVGQKSSKLYISNRTIDFPVHFIGDACDVFLTSAQKRDADSSLAGGKTCVISECSIKSKIIFCGLTSNFEATKSSFQSEIDLSLSTIPNFTLEKDTIVGEPFFLHEDSISILKLYDNYITNFHIEDCKIRYFTTKYDSQNPSPNTIKKIDFRNTSIKAFISEGDTIYSMAFYNCLLIDSIVFNNSVVKGELIFEKCKYPDKIKLINLEVEGNITLGIPKNKIKPLLIIGRLFPFEKVRFNFSQFQIVLDTTIMVSEREMYFRNLLTQQKNYGTYDDIKAADITLKDELFRQGDLFLWVQKYLWNYGYDKYLLVKRLLSFLLIFFLANLLIFKTLIHDVYVIEPIQKEFINLKGLSSKISTSIRYIVLVFLYTSVIFFGLKMDINKFKFKYLIAVFYLFAFYLIGIIFLFYSIGLILSR